MDNVTNRLAREMADAIAAAVADDQRVEACREKARAAGYELRVTLEAVVGFAGRTKPGGPGGQRQSKPRARTHQAQSTEISANDRRFLRSLRIAADEPTEKQVE
ncbi:MAG TPA: hypothetical protein VMN81_06100 [Vicinamibacterales bacterium]|nr:hypothetical protein [Vicinamibacterales bacterium]